jgi:exodeoxyribonuclease V beta subunit
MPAPLSEAATAAFDLCGPLPAGTTVLEASAGTGKTYTIAALTCRYVASGVPLERILVVTFTRMATGELRERVRHRLLTAEESLARWLDDKLVPADDDLVTLLTGGTPQEVADRRRRLAVALATFDESTIATTHQFCQRVLAGLGIVGDAEQDAAFLDDPGDLVEEIVADRYVALSQELGSEPFRLATARDVAGLATRHLLAPLAAAPGGDPTAALRRQFALEVREELERRKRRVPVLTYDDLLTRLRGTLADPQLGPAAAARLRARYRVVLVDEFQDTDPVQWEILERAFAGGGTALVLIGDPKQAIYAFRGADVYSYLRAARTGGRATLSVNRRSDEGLLRAYDALFAGARLGHPEIGYVPVEAGPRNRLPRLEGGGVGPPLRFRVAYRADRPRSWVRSDGLFYVGKVRQLVADDVAADVAAVLTSKPQILTRSDDGTVTGRKTVRPGDMAVLVRRNDQAALVQAALGCVAVPAVLAGGGSVFGTAPAKEWLRLLEALERPTHTQRAASAALTSFVGWTALRVASDDAAMWEGLHTRLHDWAEVLRRSGVAALLERITASEHLPARALALPGGERTMTDLRHVGELLHAAATTGGLGTTALTAWLRRRIDEADEEGDDESLSRRLESDAEAVQVLTVHRSKGLEFPIVYCPFLWDGPGPRTEMPAFHDPAADDRLTIDVSGSGDAYRANVAQQQAEQAGEELRLAYVALTRARHQAVVWWAAGDACRHSPLARLLFAAQNGGTDASLRGAPSDDAVAARLGELAAGAEGCVGVERIAPPEAGVWRDDRTATADLDAARFERTIDVRWRRTSYSSITAAAHEAWVASEPETPATTDEPGVAPPARSGVPAASGDEALTAVGSLLADAPAGAEFGTFVHEVFEAVDFTAADLGQELAARIADHVARGGAEVGDPATVVAALAACLRTPLGPLVGDTTLAGVARGDRLDELTFELPLAGGDAGSPGAVAGGRDTGLHAGLIADLLDEHLPAGDPLSGYAARLRDPALRPALRGYLTGSIDLVLRTRPAGGGQRFTVVDYKTNRLTPSARPLTAWHYRPEALVDAMHVAHYPLQALLYVTALHRYLRWRVVDYTASAHLGGVLYLFLRGMTGPATPRVAGVPCGIFSWDPPPALVEALSDLLDGGRP